MTIIFGLRKVYKMYLMRNFVRSATASKEMIKTLCDISVILEHYEQIL